MLEFFKNRRRLAQVDDIEGLKKRLQEVEGEFDAKIRELEQDPDFIAAERVKQIREDLARLRDQKWHALDAIRGEIRAKEFAIRRAGDAEIDNFLRYCQREITAAIGALENRGDMKASYAGDRRYSIHSNYEKIDRRIKDLRAAAAHAETLRFAADRKAALVELDGLRKSLEFCDLSPDEIEAPAAMVAAATAPNAK